MSEFELRIGPGGVHEFVEASGGIGAISVVLGRAAPVDISDTGSHPIAWDGAFDNAVDFNPIPELPAGLGVLMAIDGSDPVITFNETGIWVYTMQLSIGLDDTLAGFFGSQTAGLGGGAFVCNGSGEAQTTEVLPLPAGATMTMRVYTTIAATNPFSVAPFMTLTRLA